MASWHTCALSARQDGPIAGLSISPDTSSVVIAGRSIFKVLSCVAEDHSSDEDDPFRRRQLKVTANLRPSHRVNLNYSCTDVAWSWSCPDRLATSATNGAVVLWNLRAGPNKTIEHVFSQHTRTAHKVHFSLVESNLLASCSQDSTVRIYDVRMNSVAMTIESAGEPIRDVQFNPLEGPILAAASESGRLDIYDMRKSDRKELVFPAHNESILALDWHPELRHWIATAGRDKCVKVWLARDGASVRQPDTTLPAIAAASCVRWRPGHKAEVASGCMHMDFSVNVFDIRRPYVPQATFDDQKDATSGMAWRDKDGEELITASKDGDLFMHFHKLAPRPAERAPPMALGMDLRGGVTLAQGTRHRDKNVHVSAIEKHMSYIPPPPPLPTYGNSVMPSSTIPMIAGGHYSAQSSMVAHSYSALQQQQQQQQQILGSSYQKNSSMLDVAQQQQQQHSSADPQEDKVMTSPACSQLSYFDIVDKDRTTGAEAVTQMDWFVYTAKNYKLKGASFGDLCDHNGDVADCLGRPEVSIAWRNFKTFYGHYDVKSLIDMLPPELQSDFNDLLEEEAGLSRRRHRSKQNRNISGQPSQQPQPSIKSDDLSAVEKSTDKEKEESDADQETGSMENDLTLTNIASGSMRSSMATVTAAAPGSNIANNKTSSAEVGDPGQKAGAKEAAMEGDGDGGKKDPSFPSTAASRSVAYPEGNRGGGGGGGGVGEGADILVHEGGDRGDGLGGVAPAAAPAVATADAGGEDVGTAEDPAYVDFDHETLDPFHDLKDANDHDQASVEHFLATTEQKSSGVDVVDQVGGAAAVRGVTEDFEDILHISEEAILSYTSFEPWDPSETVKETLWQYAETGDVQSAVCMYLVLGHDRLKSLFSVSTLENWFLSYIQLLQRFRLYNEAVQIIQQSPLKEIRSMSLNSTFYYSNCSNCSKALIPTEGTGACWVCRRCKAMATRCCVCHRRSRGMFVWCQGCAHGGHMACLRAWFKAGHMQCAIGCKHYCQYQ